MRRRSTPRARASRLLLAGMGVASACRSWAPCDLHECRLDRSGRPSALMAASGSPSQAKDAAWPILTWTDPVASPGPVARMVRHGVIDCFERGARRPEPDKADEPAFCEGSAVVFDGQRLIVASDKPIPGRARSSVFEVPIDVGAGDARVGRAPARYRAGRGYARAQKLEDATLTPERDRVFLTTGFDRVRPGSTEWDGFNVLLTHAVGAPDDVQVVGLADAEPTSSVALRELLRRQVPTARFPEGAPYFKVEAIAAAPGRRLLFGIRELGESYQAFDYAVILVEARWSVAPSGRVLLDPTSFKTVYRMDQLMVEGHEVGVSSLEYDPAADRYLLLVSYEGEAGAPSAAGALGTLGGFLFVLTREGLESGAPPQPVVGPSGRPVHFLNKPEGLTLLGRDRVLVLFDDDRALVCGAEDHAHQREPHQTAFGLLQLGDPPSSIAQRR